LFSNALWFLKDNSVTPNFACISSDQPINPEPLSRNVYYTTATGSYNIVQFSQEEINKAMEWYQLLDNLVFKVASETIDQTNSLTNMYNYIRFDIPSFQRAFFFLDEARKSGFLPAKIASYISVLETLFAVKGDNTHKTAERTAVLIGNSDDERIQIYDDVSKIYDIRSKYVHGSEINDKKYKTLADISFKADEIVRNVLISMFQKYEHLNYKSKDKPEHITMNADDVDKKFNEMVLTCTKFEHLIK
jgi:hypothetical protein